MTTITDEKRAEVEKILEENPCEIYWDYRDVLTDEMVKLYCEAQDKDPELKPEWWLTDWLYENNIDYDKTEHIRYILKREGYSKEEIGELLEDGDIYGGCPLNIDAKHFLDDTVNVRFEMISNYDCFGSYWYESNGFSQPLQIETTYLGDAIDLLQLDPYKLNERIGITPADFKMSAVHEPLVDYEKFAEELENNTSDGALLTICARIPFDELNDDTFILPEGSPVGFYSSCQGGGSIFSCRLLKPLEIKVRKKPSSDYPYWMLTVDVCDGYSIKECYGQWLD